MRPTQIYLEITIQREPAPTLALIKHSGHGGGNGDGMGHAILCALAR